VAQLVVALVLTVDYRGIDYNTRQLQMLHVAVGLPVQNSRCVVAHGAWSPRLPVENGNFTLGRLHLCTTSGARLIDRS
jgi:hypothetical protein